MVRLNSNVKPPFIDLVVCLGTPGTFRVLAWENE
jgi:hypothetical protein